MFNVDLLYEVNRKGGIMKSSQRNFFAGMFLVVLLSFSLTACGGGGGGGSSNGNGGNVTVPTIDGVLSEGEWDDAISVEITVAPDWTVTVFYKHDDSNLYVAFTNLIKNNKELYPEVLLDMDNDKSSSWNLDDWWFHTSYNDCEGNGEYNIWNCSPTKSGWMANNFPLDAPGTIEIQISYEKIGLVPGKAKTIGIAFDVTDTYSEWYFWPSTAQLDSPSTWGTWNL